MTYTHHCLIRWSDLGATNQVHRTSYVDYLQEARVKLFHQDPDLVNMLDSGVLVASHRLDFRAPIIHDDTLAIETGIAAIGAARFEIVYRLNQSGQVKALAQSVLCPFDFVEQYPRRLCTKEREFLASHQMVTELLPPLAKPKLNHTGYRTEVYPRWSDLDPYHHVNNTIFFKYFEQGLLDFFNDLQLNRLESDSTAEDFLSLRVLKQDLNYLRQVNYRTEPYAMYVAPMQLNDSTMTLGIELVDETHCYASSTLVLGWVNQRGHLIELPTLVRNRMSECLAN